MGWVLWASDDGASKSAAGNDDGECDDYDPQSFSETY